MKKPKLPIQFRQATSEDVNFIFNSWLKSYRYSMFNSLISNPIYYSEQHKLIEKLVKECKTIIACAEDDATQLYGYINAGSVDNFLVINYMYVKHSFRNMGIAKALLNLFDHDPATATIYTAHTRPMDKMSIKFNMVYHPYLVFGDFDESSKPATPLKHKADLKVPNFKKGSDYDSPN